jgi:hypothetical protein
MDLAEIYEGRDCIWLVPDWDQWQALVNTAINIRIS